MSQETVVPYNPAMPQELKEQALKSNMEALNKTANGRGVNVLKSLSLTTTPTCASSGYINISNDYAFAFTSSGGVVEVNAALAYDSDTPGAVIGLAIYIDGVLMAETHSAQNGGSVRWIGALAAGNHRVEVRWKANAGTLTMTGTNTVQVVEYLF